MLIFGGIFDLENTNKSFKIKDKMKQLFLLRHGEAGFTNKSDFERSLTQNGIQSLHKMGQVLIKQRLSIDIAYCSPAKRTLETSELFQGYVKIDQHIFVKEIYEGDVKFLLGLLNQVPFSIKSCIIIGHNPTLSDLLSYLTQGDFIGLEPGMLASISLPVDNWELVGSGIGILDEIVL